MNHSNAPSRLSKIETLWSVVNRAHSDEPSVVDAQQQLLQLYGSAIRRYLLAAVRNPDLADELFQEFAMKFVKGDFRGADPSKGRFRSFVKTVLSRLVALHFRKLNARKEQPFQDYEEPTQSPNEDGQDAFVESWREELLSRTWSALEDDDRKNNKFQYAVLQIRVTDPSLDSTELAERISERIGKKTNGGAARVMVHRAREKFARLLIDVVSESLDEKNREAVEEELIELGLIDYCQDVLNKWK